MKLANSFSIDRPPGEVFEAFLDVERVATCMPGSRLLGQPDPDTYEGEVKVKVGPLGVAYSGRLTLLEVDRDQMCLTMRAKGREQHGAGNADAHVVARLSGQGSGTLVEIETDLSIRGKVAQFGRGVIGEVTDSIMATFARNVEQLLASGGPTAAPTTQAAAAGAAPPPGAGAEPSPADSSDDLDVWRLVVRPMLHRQAGSIATIALSGLAAYIGARAGASRAAGRRAR